MSVCEIPDDVSIEEFNKNVKIFFMVCERIFSHHLEKELEIRNKVVLKPKASSSPMLDTNIVNMYENYFNELKSKYENKALDAKPEVRFSVFKNLYDEIDIDLFAGDTLSENWIQDTYILTLPKPTKKNAPKPKPNKIYLYSIHNQAKACEEYYASKKESAVDKTNDRYYISLKFQRSIIMVFSSVETRPEQKEQLLKFVKQIDDRIIKRSNEVEQMKKEKTGGIVGMIKGAISSSGYNFGEGAVDTIINKISDNSKLKGLLDKFNGITEGNAPDVSDDLAVDLLEGVGNVISDLKQNMKNGTAGKALDPTKLLDVVGDAFERSEKSVTNNNNTNVPKE